MARPAAPALETLKSRIDHLFGTRGRGCFPDVWAVRDAFIRVILDRGEPAVRCFFREFGYPDLDEATVQEGLWLLEMERHAMLMFTSCGWFFDEISGLETTQCLRYAARAIQLAQRFGRDFEPEFVALLEEAPSNLPQYANGRAVWEKLIRPARVEIDRVLAHHAISLIFHRREPHTRVYCFDLEVIDHEVHTRGTNHLAVGRMRARSRTTWHEAETTFVVLHYGGLDFYTVLRKGRGTQEYDTFRKQLLDTYRTHSLADVTTLLVKEFNGQVHRLDDLFAAEQRHVIGIALQDRFRDYRATFERLADQDQDLLNLLGQLHFPVPKPMRLAASAYLDYHLRTEIAALAGGGNLQRIRLLYERGQTWGYQPEREVLGRQLSELLQQVLCEMNPASDLPEAVVRAGTLLDAANLLGASVDLWQAQNRLLDACARLHAADALPAGLHELFGTLGIKLNLSPELLGQRF